MKIIVITGSTRGIGRGMAEEFLKRGCAVVVSGRRNDSVQKEVSSLAVVHGADRVFGQACDVSDEQQVQALWDAAITKFGKVDIWINNAGVNHIRQPFWKVDKTKIKQVMETNYLGVANGMKIAFLGMISQGDGFIYNMEGLGSSGPPVSGVAYYASSKSAVSKLTQIAILDAKESPVRIGYLSPGMVITDLLMKEGEKSGDNWERQKRLYNILADRVETVTPFLVQKMLNNQKHGARIAWLTTGKSFVRFIRAPFVKRDLFANKE